LIAHSSVITQVEKKIGRDGGGSKKNGQETVKKTQFSGSSQPFDGVRPASIAHISNMYQKIVALLILNRRNTLTWILSSGFMSSLVYVFFINLKTETYDGSLSLILDS